MQPNVGHVAKKPSHSDTVVQGKAMSLLPSSALQQDRPSCQGLKGRFMLAMFDVHINLRAEDL